MSTINKILGKIKTANESKTQLSSKKIELAKAMTILVEAEDLGGNIQFFEDRFKDTEKRGLDALRIIEETIEAADKIVEEADNQLQDAKSLKKEATSMGQKLEKVSQTLKEADLDTGAVDAEMRILEDVFGELDAVENMSASLKSRANKFLAKL